MKIHWCLLDRQCRSYGCPPRIHLTIGARHWFIDPFRWSDRGYHRS